MRTLTSASCIGYRCRANASRSSASNNTEFLSMLRLEKWPPAPKVTSSNPPLRFLRGGAASMNNRIACSMSRLTDVPDSDARCFSFASRLSSSVIVVRMMHDHTSLASVHQEPVMPDAVTDHEIQEMLANLEFAIAQDHNLAKNKKCSRTCHAPCTGC